MELLILVIDISRSLELVGSGLCNGVDTAADEVGLTHIIRRNHNLDFVDCIQRDRISSSGKTVGKTEVVVEVSAVNREVGATSVHSGETHSATSVRRKLCHIGDAPVDRRHCKNVLVGNVGRCSCLFLSCELGCRGGDDHYLIEKLGRFLDFRIEVVCFSKLKGDVIVDNTLVAEA